jgi:hypothetical protein
MPRLLKGYRLAQLSRKLLSFLDLDGCFIFLSAFASIWRMRSRVTENCWSTSHQCRRKTAKYVRPSLEPRQPFFSTEKTVCSSQPSSERLLSAAERS